MFSNTNSQFQNPQTSQYGGYSQTVPIINQSQVGKPVYQPQQPQPMEVEMKIYRGQNQVSEMQVHNPQPIKQNASQIVVQNQFHDSSSVKQNQKVSYLIDWVMYFLPIGFIILILIVMSCMVGAKIKHFNPEGAHNTLSTLKDNLSKNPIEDLVEGNEVASHTTMIDYFRHKDIACPDGYEIAQIGKWDGVKSGCLCENGETSHSTTCFYKSSCKRVKSHDSVDLKIWQQKSFCIKKYEDWHQLTGVACDNGYKLCGNICVPMTRRCPLSNLVKDNSRSNDEHAIKIGSDHFIKKFEDSEPVVDLQLVPGLGQSESSPCYNHDLNPRFQSEKYYPFAKRAEKGCDQYLDLQNHRTTLNTFEIHKVFEQNDLNDVLNQLPFYQSYMSNEDTYAFELIKRIKINSIQDCQKLKPNQVDKISSSSKSVYHAEQYLSFIILLIAAMALFLVPILYLIRNRVFEWKDMTEFRQPRFFCGSAAVIATLCVVLGAIYLYHVDGNDGLKEHNHVFQTYLEKSCFQDQGLILAVDQVNTFAKNVYHSTYSYVIFAFYGSICYFVILALLMIYQFWQHKSNFENPWQYRIQKQYYEFY
ncbi:unnamed protein product (macronuclear) [Paramecium tetraurelia]|uniref:Transmembrane protein n=1 Tax=Paramecium tetraurelia TaxID=5888 RepID=A0BKD7_PARTE|nr:uncharacterized protein GSPATT00029635001 [Paramecium tetraurelia]CAK59004.1 unnamed protein product [Paramecium tetraurelia]|eukprot:XP_001426402.1 hypothetical protein (macronuclear) [Paramecium tetraurelia strain d4-2]